MLTFENSSVQGAGAITEKLTVRAPLNISPETIDGYLCNRPAMLISTSDEQSLPFQQVRHQLATLDAQPSGDCIIVLVTGALLVCH